MTKYWGLGLLVLTGCGGMTTPTAKPLGAQRDLALTTTVQFVGDDISAGLVSYANNTMWRCDDCITKADSLIALNNFPAALATNPNVIVITVGSYDIHGDTFAGTFDQDCTSGICDYVQSMVTQAQAAGISVIVGTIPPFGQGSAALYYQDCCDVGYEIELNQADWNNQIAKLFPQPGPIPVVDFAGALQQNGPTGDPAWTYDINRYIPSFTTNGIDPNAAGYAQMQTLIAAEISKLKVGGVK